MFPSYTPMITASAVCTFACTTPFSPITSFPPTFTDTTTLEFVHHSVNRKAVGELGPGWEYYLDALVASREGQPGPKFDAYYPSQKAYFTSLEG